MKDFLYFVAAFAVFIAVAKLVFDLRMRKHRGVSRDEFIRAFSGLNIPTEIPEAVHDYYKRMVMFKNFGVAPDDTFEELHKGDEDIDDDGRFLLKKLGMELPIQPVREEWDKPLKTLRDMVLWLSWVRQHQEVAPSSPRPLRARVR
jgi:hypothetical protein